MQSGRILVVDDLPDWRAMIGGLLEDAGYDVQVAEDEESAMRLLRGHPFHVAILDLRLDEPDEQNREGLLLAERMKTYMPELAVIMFTGHADLSSLKIAREPRSGGGPITYDFLEKHEIAKLLERIRMAFTDEAKINPTLQIVVDPKLDWTKMRSDVKCLRSLDPNESDQEIIDLLMRIFHVAEMVEIKPLLDGHSGSTVILATPRVNGIKQAEVAVKFAERAKAELEQNNYDRYVASLLGSPRRTQRLDFQSHGKARRNRVFVRRRQAHRVPSFSRCICRKGNGGAQNDTRQSLS